MLSGTMCSAFSRSRAVPSPPMAIIFSMAGCVRSLPSLARPSRWAIHTLSCFRLITKCMYSDMCFDAASSSRGGSWRCTMNDLLILTTSLIHGAASRLSPMAISVVVPAPASNSSTQSSAESSTMSRWLLTKVYRPSLMSMASASIVRPVDASAIRRFRKV